MFEQLTVRTRILGLIIFGVIIIAVLGGNAYQSLREAEREIQSVLDNIVNKRIYFGEIREQLGYDGIIHEFKNYVLRGDPRFKEQFYESTRKLRDQIARYRAIEGLDPVEREALKTTEDVVEKFISNIEIVNELHSLGRTPGEIDQQVIIDEDETKNALNKLGEYLGNRWDMETMELVEQFNTTLNVQITIVLITALLLVVFGVLTVRSITSPLAILLQATDRLGSGDLKERVPSMGNNEIGRLGNSFNQMADNLAKMVSETAETANTVASMVQELQSSVGSQSSAATQQASSINETTTSLEEIKATSHQTLEKATVVGDSSSRTREEGENGLDMVQKIIDGMREIRGKVTTIAENILALSEQTQQIGEITNTVNMLSQQLKMIGLNASIEAAKAGEAGQGFAVVAGEVKELAEQSQQATVQVHKILEAIQQATDKAVMVTEEGSKGVDEGVALVEQTGSAVRNLSDVINDTSVASQQIVAAVRQETSGIEQVTQAMNEINKATSQVVSATEQTKQVASQLGEISQRLQGSVRIYNV